MMLADSYVNEHKTEAIFTYIDIFNSLQAEFKDRTFILIFDQFETVGKASIDFLIDFLKYMPERFHAIISFSYGESSSQDTVAKSMYEYVTNHLQNEGARALKITQYHK